MRILFEASTLGTAQFSQLTRTGVYRMTDGALRALVAANAGEITLTVFDSPIAQAGLRKYVAGLPAGQRPLMQRDLRQLALGAIFGAGKRFSDTVLRASPGVARAGRAVYGWTLAARQRFASGAAAGARPRTWPTFDVCHSPFEPLPDDLPSPRVLTVHDLIPLSHPEWFREDTLAYFDRIIRSIRPTDTVLSVSAHVKSELCERLGLAEERVFVTPLAADPALFRPVAPTPERRATLARFGIPEQPYFLAVGTLEPRKNLVSLLRAFAAAVEGHGLDANLVLVGPRGWKCDAILHEMRASTRVGQRIFWTGYVDDRDLASLYSAALAFVFPSHAEGFGLPVLEAMQCGAAVIASNATSVPEVVGDAGLLVAPGDQEAISAALVRMASDAPLRADLAARAALRAATFTWARHAERTIAAYRAAIASHSPPRV